MVILPCKDCGNIPQIKNTGLGFYADCYCGKLVSCNSNDVSMDGAVDVWNRVNYVEQRSIEAKDAVPELTIDDIYGDEFAICDLCKTPYVAIEDTIDCHDRCKEKYRIFELEKNGQGILKL